MGSVVSVVHHCTASIIMDIDRVIMMSSQDTHGSLLNRVYELQCIREKELETMDLTEQMSSLSFSVSVPTVSSSDASQTSHPEVDDISSNLSHMCQAEDSIMEDSLSQEEVELEDKFSQARARSDPVYIHQKQQQLQLQLQQQQQLQLQQQQQLQLQEQQQLQQQLQHQHQQQQLQLQPQYHPSLVSHQQCHYQPL